MTATSCQSVPTFTDFTFAIVGIKPQGRPQKHRGHVRPDQHRRAGYRRQCRTPSQKSRARSRRRNRHDARWRGRQRRLARARSAARTPSVRKFRPRYRAGRSRAERERARRRHHPHLADSFERRDALADNGLQLRQEFRRVVGDKFRPPARPADLDIEALLRDELGMVGLESGDHSVNRATLKGMHGRCGAAANRRRGVGASRYPAAGSGIGGPPIVHGCVGDASAGQHFGDPYRPPVCYPALGACPEPQWDCCRSHCRPI